MKKIKFDNFELKSCLTPYIYIREHGQRVHGQKDGRCTAFFSFSCRGHFTMKKKMEI